MYLFVILMSSTPMNEDEKLFLPCVIFSFLALIFSVIYASNILHASQCTKENETTEYAS